MSKMFQDVGRRINPFAVKCKHGCPYKCWALDLIKNRPPLTKKYSDNSLVYKELKKIENAPADEILFVGSMTDIMGDWIPKEWICLLMESIAKSKATVMLCTKAPWRYSDFELPDNIIFGATIETDKEFPTGAAPSRMDRLAGMTDLDVSHKMISIEPIMDFTVDFAARILLTQPDFVYVGYDNYKSGLNEPSLAKTRILIADLRNHGVKVYEKTLREAIT